MNNISPNFQEAYQANKKELETTNEYIDTLKSRINKKSQNILKKAGRGADLKDEKVSRKVTKKTATERDLLAKQEIKANRLRYCDALQIAFIDHLKIIKERASTADFEEFCAIITAAQDKQKELVSSSKNMQELEALIMGSPGDVKEYENKLEEEKKRSLIIMEDLSIIFRSGLIITHRWLTTEETEKMMENSHGYIVNGDGTRTLKNPPSFSKPPPKHDVNKKFIDDYTAGIKENKESYGVYYEAGEAFGNLLKSTRNPFLAQGGEFSRNFAKLVEVGVNLNTARKALASSRIAPKDISAVSDVATKVIGKVGNVIGMAAIFTTFIIPGMHWLTYAIYAGYNVKWAVNYLIGTPELTEFQESMKAIQDTRAVLERLMDTKSQHQDDLLTQHHREMIEQFLDLSHCMATIEHNIISYIETGIIEVKEEIHSQTYVDFITRVETNKAKISNKLLTRAENKTLATHLSTARNLALSPTLNAYIVESRGNIVPAINLSFLPRNPAFMTGLLGIYSGHSRKMPNWAILEGTIDTFRKVFSETNTKTLLDSDFLPAIIEELTKIQKYHNKLSDFFNFDQLVGNILAHLEVIKKDIKSTTLENAKRKDLRIRNFNKNALENFLQKGVPLHERLKRGSKRFILSKLLAGKSLAGHKDFHYTSHQKVTDLSLAKLAEGKTWAVTYTPPSSIFSPVQNLYATLRGGDEKKLKFSHTQAIKINLNTKKIYVDDTSSGGIPIAVLTFYRTIGREYYIKLEKESNPLIEGLSKIQESNIDETSYDKSLDHLHQNYFDFVKAMCSSTAVSKTNIFSDIQSTSVVIRSETNSMPLVFPKKLIELLESSFSDVKKYFEITNYGFFLTKYSFCKATGKLDIIFDLDAKGDQREFCRFTVATLDDLTVDSFDFHITGNKKVNSTLECLMQALYCCFGNKIGMPGASSQRLENGLVVPVDRLTKGFYRVWENQTSITSCSIHYHHAWATPNLFNAEIVYSSRSAKIMREFFEIRQNLQKTCLPYKKSFYLLESNINLISSIDRKTLMQNLKEKFGMIDGNNIISLFDDHVKGIAEKTPSRKDFDAFVKLINNLPSYRVRLYNQQREQLANYIRYLQDAANNNEITQLSLSSVALRRIEYKSPMNYVPVIANTDMGEVITLPPISETEDNSFTTDEFYRFYQSEIKRDFEFINVPGDGNCMFHSVIELLKNAGLEDIFKDHTDLRAQIIAEMKSASFDVAFLHYDENKAVTTPEAYLARMSKDAEWGGDAELAAFLSIMDKKSLPVRLVIHDWINANSQKRPDAEQEKDPAYSTPIPDELRRGTRGPVLHIYRSGLHYQALKPRELSAAAPAV